MKGLVSVIMGVHNENPAYLRTAVDSICAQTYKNLEFIIVDDAANEPCRQLLADCEARHSNIKILHNSSNIGLTKSLNKALAAAGGEYIARMDADDFSVPDRIEKQVRFMEDNPDIDVCGTGVVTFGGGEKFMSPMNGLDSRKAACFLFFSSTICHPSAMVRAIFLQKNNLEYDESIKSGQDFDLWERCSVCGKLAVMPQVLLYYRLHPGQITAKCSDDQQLTSDMVRRRRLSRIGLAPTEAEYKCHLLLASGVSDDIFAADVLAWKNKLLEANRSEELADPDEFEKDLDHRFFLYKMRNRKVFSAIRAADAGCFCRMISDNIARGVKLSRATAALHKLLPNE